MIATTVHAIEVVAAKLQGAKTIVAAMAAAEPRGFFQHLSRPDSQDFLGARIYCANPSKDYGCFTCPRPYELVVMFLTAPVVQHQGHGHVQYCPQHLSQWAGNLQRRGPVDVFWGVCTPPDSRGFVSLGPGACYESQIRRMAKTVVLEINPHLPTTFGDTHVPVSEVDFFVDGAGTLPTIGQAEPDAIDHKIASFVEALIPEGATLQLGIGKIPNAVSAALSARRDLGVHTEMINDAMMILAEKGVITGRHKTLWPGKIVGSFAFGSQALYNFIDRNPLVELQPASVVNDPYRIGRNFRMVSINTAVEIDITGQVCSESIGHKELSGVGGAFETHIGAQRSEGGVGMIALRSRTNDGKSKISATLLPGAKVSISRNDVDTVVTEYGVAALRGLSVKERVKALVQIAHPDCRDGLERQAYEARYL